MEETDSNMSEEKKQKNYRETKKLKLKIFFFFSFHCIKHGTRNCVFWRKWYH